MANVLIKDPTGVGTVRLVNYPLPPASGKGKARKVPFLAIEFPTITIPQSQVLPGQLFFTIEPGTIIVQFTHSVPGLRRTELVPREDVRNDPHRVIAKFLQLMTTAPTDAAVLKRGDLILVPEGQALDGRRYLSEIISVKDLVFRVHFLNGLAKHNRKNVKVHEISFIDGNGATVMDHEEHPIFVGDLPISTPRIVAPRPNAQASPEEVLDDLYSDLSNLGNEGTVDPSVRQKRIRTTIAILHGSNNWTPQEQADFVSKLDRTIDEHNVNLEHGSVNYVPKLVTAGPANTPAELIARLKRQYNLVEAPPVHAVERKEKLLAMRDHFSQYTAASTEEKDTFRYLWAQLARRHNDILLSTSHRINNISKRWLEITKPAILLPQGASSANPIPIDDDGDGDGDGNGDDDEEDAVEGPSERTGRSGSVPSKRDASSSPTREPNDAVTTTKRSKTSDTEPAAGRAQTEAPIVQQDAGSSITSEALPEQACVVCMRALRPGEVDIASVLGDRCETCYDRELEPEDEADTDEETPSAAMVTGAFEADALCYKCSFIASDPVKLNEGSCRICVGDPEAESDDEDDNSCYECSWKTSLVTELGKGSCFICKVMAACPEVP